jgi:predicted nucleic acid-binding Zn ribbon protein
MPIYEYRCECGDVVEALVRGGREPFDARDVGHYCDTEGRLKKLISAHNVGHGGGSAYRVSESGAAEVPASEGCGHCGTPTACSYD